MSGIQSTLKFAWLVRAKSKEYCGEDDLQQQGGS